MATTDNLTNGLFDKVQEAQTNGATAHTNGVHPTTNNSPKFSNQHAFTPRKLRVITIGAGFSGLLMAHKFQHRFPEMQKYVEHTIFEGHKQLGGTWLVNTYPGVQCDVPSHIYVSKAEVPGQAEIAF